MQFLQPLTQYGSIICNFYSPCLNMAVNLCNFSFLSMAVKLCNFCTPFSVWQYMQFLQPCLSMTIYALSATSFSVWQYMQFLSTYLYKIQLLGWQAAKETRKPNQEHTANHLPVLQYWLAYSAHTGLPVLLNCFCLSCHTDLPDLLNCSSCPAIHDLPVLLNCPAMLTYLIYLYPY